MIIALVCARAGSEGLPGKNTRELCGKPLIDWTVEAGHSSMLIDIVVIVTDIKGLTLPPGVLLLKEPANLAGPQVAKWDVWRWATIEIENRLGEVETVVDLDVTRPLKTTDDIDRCIEAFYASPGEPHIVMAIAPAKKNPRQDLLERDGQGRLHLSVANPGYAVRQDLPPCYEHGGVYVVERDALRWADVMFGGDLEIEGVEIPWEHAQDIDTPTDWTIVELLMKSQLAEVS